jgi:hypothetical protein
LAIAALAIPATASVSYNTPGIPYLQNFNTFPITPENASLQTTTPWVDDTAATATNTGLVGWYLFHPIAQATEGGSNQHQRFRVTPGTQNTGSFYSFGSTGNNDRALGDITSNTLSNVPGAGIVDTDVFIALRLTNNTGQTLTGVDVAYNGEQWRDGGAATPASDALKFAYSLNATAINDAAATFTPVGALDFVSPIFANTTGTSLDGNAAANRLAKSATISGINWAPGTDLWLRWADTNISTADHGLAIDDLSVTGTVPEPATLTLAATAAIGMLAQRRRTRA